MAYCFPSFYFQAVPLYLGESPGLSFALLSNLTTSLLIEVFSQYTFNIITELLGLDLTYYYLISICPVYFFFSPFLPSFRLIKNFIISFPLHQHVKYFFIILFMVTPEQLFSTGFHQRIMP